MLGRYHFDIILMCLYRFDVFSRVVDIMLFVVYYMIWYYMLYYTLYYTLYYMLYYITFLHVVRFCLMSFDLVRSRLICFALGRFILLSVLCPQMCLVTSSNCFFWFGISLTRTFACPAYLFVFVCFDLFVFLFIHCFIGSPCSGSPNVCSI